MIHILEERALNAWPALQQMVYDGWLLRFAEGYTRRANSVTPLYDSRLAVQPKIERCIQIYQTKNLRPIFRLPPLAQSEALDDRLARLGFTKQSLTSVQQLELDSFQGETPSTFEWRPAVSTGWLDHFTRLKGDLAAGAAHRAILNRIVPPACFALVSYREQVVACGLAVLETPYVGLFDLVTAEPARRRGFGRSLLKGLLQWAKCQGAATAYLQVEISNRPAQNLYQTVGFAEVYRYWYRVRQFSAA